MCTSLTQTNIYFYQIIRNTQLSVIKYKNLHFTAYNYKLEVG